MSAVTQEAVKQTLAARSTDSWLSTLPLASAQPMTHDRMLDALDAAADALYVELATTGGGQLVTTDRRLQGVPTAEVVYE